MEKVFDRKENCFGCSACMASCPVGAIKMQADNKGFLYPVIEQKKCINCGKCKRVCQIFHHHDVIETCEKPEVYVCHNKNQAQRIESSSGGVTYILEQYVLRKGGVVFGAVYDEHMKVVHTVIERIEDCSRLQKSKYVQSDMGDTLSQIKQYLECGRTVLFIGTPCQVGGLYEFLGKDYQNLYTIDLICFGVPSPKVFEAYINWFEKKENEKVQFVDCRNKRNGWQNSSTSILCASGKEYVTNSNENEYYQTFSSHIAIRESCGRCIYTNIKRYADLTVGDYWGIEKYRPEYNVSAGVSKLLVNTEKGRKLFDDIKDEIYSESMLLETAIRPNLLAPLALNEKREEFFYYFEKHGFYKAYKKYVRGKTENKTMRRIKALLKKVVRK